MNYCRLHEKIDTDILETTKLHQSGRVSNDDTNVSFNFTEWWFRNSGIYELQPERQEQFMNWFLDGKQKGTKQQKEKVEILKEIQEQIGESIGWSRKKVADYCRLKEAVVPHILENAKSNQEGRGTEDVPNGTFNFTEGWFHNSGIYELQPGRQQNVRV